MQWDFHQTGEEPFHYCWQSLWDTGGAAGRVYSFEEEGGKGGGLSGKGLSPISVFASVADFQQGFFFSICAQFMDVFR